MKKCIFIFLLTWIGLAQAQNLVPNPGFNLFSICPTNQNQLFRATPWVNPNTSTPDFWHSCNNAVPSNPPVYFQQDHSNLNGGYVSIYTFISGAFIDYQAREYVQVALNDTLQHGVHYCVEFYVSLTEYSGIANSDIGLYLSDSSIYENSIYQIPVIPQIENPDSIILSDTSNWMRIGGYYLANGGERFITIGNFRDSASSHAVIVNSSSYQFAYYLIDDVSIVNCDSLFSDVNDMNPNPDVLLFPNPVKDQITLDFKGHTFENVEVCVLSMIGHTERTSINKWANKVNLNLGNLSSGLYIVTIRSKNIIITKKFLKE